MTPSGTVASSIIPILILALVSFAANYAVLSNPDFLTRLLEKASQRASTSEERERLEAVSESTMRVLQNPIFRGLISAEHSFVAVRTFLLIVFGGGMILGLLTGRWRGLSEYWKATSVSSSVLDLGIVVDHFLKFLLTDDGAGLSASVFLGRQDVSEMIFFVLNRSGFFVLWFFWIVALRVSDLFGETPFQILMIFCLVWILLLLVLFQLEIQGWILF